MRVPVWELGFPFEAKDASENARNLTSGMGMFCILIVTSWCFLASWRVWLALISVSTVALLMEDCK